MNILKDPSKDVLVTLSEEFAQQVHILHSLFSKPDVEWSGYLIFEETGGSFEEGTLTLHVHSIYPLASGSSTYTEYVEDGTMLDILEKYPDVASGKHKLGWIHTHHSMSTFYSVTDNADVVENTPKYPMYFTMIVNHKFDCDEYSGLVSVVGRRKVIPPVVQYRKGKKWKKWGVFSKKEREKEVAPEFEDCILAQGCNFERLADENFVEAVDKLLAKNKEKVAKTTPYPSVIGFTPSSNPYASSSHGVISIKGVEANDRSVNSFLKRWLVLDERPVSHIYLPSLFFDLAKEPETVLEEVYDGMMSESLVRSIIHDVYDDQFISETDVIKLMRACYKLLDTNPLFRDDRVAQYVKDNIISLFLEDSSDEDNLGVSTDGKKLAEGLSMTLDFGTETDF